MNKLDSFFAKKWLWGKVSHMLWGKLSQWYNLTPHEALKLS